ncbi:MAG: 50S ribosomal protein L30 [Xanthomonadaceae bacterium]|nr:50S ribosomal protein L30 [Xanthomonadaceae bacterium]
MAKAKAKQKQLKVKLVKSAHGRLAAHRATVSGLGLRRMHHEVTVADTPEVRGMINSISYLIKVEEV